MNWQAYIWAGVFGVSLLGQANIALAQDAAEPAPDSVEEGQEAPETFTITARKQEETLEEAPVSVTAFGADTLREQGITDINDVATRTPGFNYGNFGDEKLSPVSLRGVVGGSSSAGSDPAVGIYMDEVYLGPGVGASVDLFDMQQVEVLRGPQGTLFGHNTIGGLIHYRTAAPTDYYEALGEVEVGNYEYRRFSGAVSGPLYGDDVLGRLSMTSTQRGGFSDNTFLHRDVNTEGSWAVRGQLLFNLWDATTWRLSADYREVDQDSLVFETLRYNPGSDFVFAMGFFGAETNTDPYDRRVRSNIVSGETAEAGGITSTFETTINDVNIVNVTSYRSHQYRNIADTDRTELDWAYDGDPEDVWRWSNEFRVSGSVGSFDWLAGIYYSDQETDNQSFIALGADLATLLGDPGLAGLEAGSNALMNAQNLAGFGTLTWYLTDQFDLTVGGRYTHEEKDIEYVQTDPVFLLGGDFAINASDSWSQFTPSVNARYRFNDEVMVYATVSQGYKSGGFNDALGDATGISFDPELLWNYEAGLRTTFYDGRMFMGLTAFYMDWTDIQTSGDNPATPVFDPITLNAGAAHSTGVEFELMGQLTDNLRVGLNAALLEAEYDEGMLPDGTILNQIPYAPEYTINVNGDYRANLLNNIDWFVGGEYLVRGETYLTLNNQPDGQVDPYGVLNLRVGLEDDEGRWALTLWGRNVTDEVATQRLFDLYGQDLIGQKFIVRSDPATYGVNLRVRY